MLASLGVKAWSGKEDTTLLSMAVCRVKQLTVSTATRYGINPGFKGVQGGAYAWGSKHPSKKKISFSEEKVQEIS